MRKLSIPALLLVVTVCVGLYAQETYILKIQVAVANVRSGPDAFSPTIKQVKKDTLLEAKKKIGDWFEVALPNDKGEPVTGYINSAFVQVISVGEKQGAVRQKPQIAQIIKSDENPYAKVPLNKHVNDMTRRLEREEEDQFEKFLSDAVQTDKIHVIVLIIRSYKVFKTPDATLESFARNLFHAQLTREKEIIEVGLIVLNMEDMKVTMIFGQSYGQNFNNKIRTIITNTMMPDIKMGNLSRGLTQGARKIIDEIKNFWK